MDFRKLKIYTLAIEFVKEIYKLSKEFPQDELFGLTSQMRRAAVSVALNIAEGSGSSSDIEFSRFLKISIRSLYEVDAILEIANALSYCDKKRIEKIYNTRIILGRMTGQFIKKLTS